MTDVTRPTALAAASHRRTGIVDRFARRVVLHKLEQLEFGRLTLTDVWGSRTFGEPAGTASLVANVEILDPAAYRYLAFGGTVGAGESYMSGHWRADDLVILVRLLLRNRAMLDRMERGLARLAWPISKLIHLSNVNSKAGARRNIAAHYDLGNDFFALWLDESMMYSSAIFDCESMSLAEAQRHRLDVVCRKLDLKPDDHLIEIGTGWGGLAIHAAQQYGCRVTTTTISRNQYELAKRRVCDANLGERIQVLLEDYRDLRGQYDKLVSIEMIEAIGSQQYDGYFAKCSELLKPGGKMLIQAITISDAQYQTALSEVDFIQRYIFPGGCLPSLDAMAAAIKRTSALAITGIEDIGRHYALTLRHWRRNFFDQLDRIRALGYPDEFIRMWEFYLTYCEGGFAEKAISDVHLVADKPS
jgi:cyclopropane-fatty-acyl-phospholipid synthase